jgi:hypothetical protein
MQIQTYLAWKVPWAYIPHQILLPVCLTLHLLHQLWQRHFSTRTHFTGEKKVHPCTGTEALYRPYSPYGEYRYSSTLSWPTALEGGEGSASRPDRSLPLGKTWYPLYRRLCGPQGQSGQVRKISPPPGLNPRTVQPVASRYTNYAIWPTHFIGNRFLYLDNLLVKCANCLLMNCLFN